MTMEAESKDKEHKVRSLDNILFPFLIIISILFLVLAIFVMDKELLDRWNKFFGSTVLGW
jgi:hypothetical protein